MKRIRPAQYGSKQEKPIPPSQLLKHVVVRTRVIMHHGINTARLLIGSSGQKVQHLLYGFFVGGCGVAEVGQATLMISMILSKLTGA